MPFAHRIDDRAALRRYYADPHPAIANKAIDHIDPRSRDFIARAPFVVLATTGDRGTDASPRGGPPGFVRVLDERRVALGDLAGNRRLDSFENVLSNPAVGLLLLVPGVGETVRINGQACLTTDPAVLDACTIDGTRPGVALGIDVDEVFLHCAKAFRRSRLWDPTSWPADGERPRAGEIVRSQFDLDVPAETIEADLEAGYRATMWEPGGTDTVTDTGTPEDAHR
jgi:uncharacterized protein